MQTVKSELIDSIVQNFRPVNQTFSGFQNATLFLFNYTFTNITVNSFSMNYDNSKIEFREHQPNIHVELNDFIFNMTFNYSLKADPEFYVDEGPSQIEFYFENITIGLGMINVEGVPQFIPQDIFAKFKGANTYFGGGGDLSYILNTASVLLKNQMEKGATELVTQMVGFVVPMLNSQLSKNGCTMSLMQNTTMTASW